MMVFQPTSYLPPTPHPPGKVLNNEQWLIRFRYRKHEIPFDFGFLGLVPMQIALFVELNRAHGAFLVTEFVRARTTSTQWFFIAED